MNERYTIEQTANFIRTNPTYTGIYGTDEWKDDHKLVQHWIEKFPDTKNYLTDLPRVNAPATSYDRPEGAAGDIDKIKFNMKSQIANVKPMIGGLMTAMLDDRNMINGTDQAIRNWEDKLDEMDADPTSDPRRYKYIKEQLLPSLVKRRKQQYDLYRQNTSRDWMYEHVKDYSVTWRAAADEYLDELIANDTEMQARLNWERDNPIDSMNAAFGSIDMVTRSFSELASSMAFIIGPTVSFKMLGGAAKLAKLTSAADKLNKTSKLTGSAWYTVPTMFAMEGGGIYKEVMDYLTKEYKYTNPDGDVITGLAPEDAMIAAGMVTANYGLIATMLEKFQVNRTMEALGAKKAVRSAVTMKLVDRIMKTLPKSYGHSGLLRVSSAAGSIGNLALYMTEEGLVEGWQAAMEVLHTEAVKEGFGVDSPAEWQNLYSELGLKAEEVGIKNIAWPYTSDIPMVRESAYTGMVGTGGPGGIRVSSDLWSGTISPVINEIRNGDDVVIEKSSDGKSIVLRNETKNKVTFVPAGSKSEQKIIHNTISSALAEDEILVERPNIETPEDYAEVLLSYVSGDESAMGLEDLVESFEESDIKKSKLKQMIYRDSGKNTKRHAVTISDAVTNLVKFTGDPNFLTKLINKKERTQDEIDNIRGLISATANTIRNSQTNRLTNKISKGNIRSGKEKIQGIINQIPSDKIIEKELSGILEKEVADEFNVDDKFHIEGAERAEPIGLTSLETEQAIHSEESEDRRLAEETLYNKLNTKRINKANNVNKAYPITDINDTRNVDGRRLYSHIIGELFDGVAGNEANINNIYNAIIGKGDLPRLNNTQLARIAKVTKVKLDKKKLKGKVYGYRAKIAKQIAAKIVDQLSPSPAQAVTKRPAARVVTKPSPAEAIVEGAPAKKVPAKKAPAKKALPKAPRLLVTGGRKYANKAEARKALQAFIDTNGKPEVLIHGGATGADRLLGSIAKEMGIKVKVRPALWDKEGKAAGPKRNQRMLDKDKPTHVLAFEGGRGTADMTRRAKAKGLEVVTPGTIKAPVKAPTVELVNRLSVALLRKNPDKVYLFGDNLEGRGKLGQAIIRDEPNAYGIPTKKKPSMTADSFFTERNLGEYTENIKAIDNALAKIPLGKTIVIPSAGLGTGLAKLKTKAPKTFKYLENMISLIKSEGIGPFKIPAKAPVKAPIFDPLAEIAAQDLEVMKSKADKETENESKNIEDAETQTDSVIKKIDDDIIC